MRVVIVKSSSIESAILEKMQNVSKTKIKQWLKHNQIFVNGESVRRIDHPLALNDVLEVRFNLDPTATKKFKPKFTIVFEDQYLVIAVKPPGVLTVADRGDPSPSFYKQVQEYVKENSKGRENLFVVHRLDREVAGMVIFAKTESVLKILKESWKEHTKSYLALVHGKVQKKEGVIESHLTEDPETLLVYSTTDYENKDVKHAITHYKILEAFPDKTLLEITLDTGRKNQIRIHLAEMGHPIVGDRRYGADDRFKRQIRLYSYYLKLLHPITEKYKEFRLPIPANFLQIANHNEKYK